MKYRWMGAIAVVVILATAFAASWMDSDAPISRVHQHLTARQPNAGCSCDGSELCTHLPLVTIDTEHSEIPGAPILNENGKQVGLTTTSTGDSMLNATISVMSSDTHNHHPSDVPDLKSSMQIRIRGNSSRYFDKKSYLIRLTEADGSYRDEEMMGMASHYEWALQGPYLDKSLIRNYMWYNIAGELMEYAPNVRFCEVILNGEYQGVYLMTETITNGDDCRIDVSEPVEGSTNTGYLLRLDRGSSNPIKNISPFSNYTLRNQQYIDIKYPRSGDLTPEMAAAISQDFSDFEKSLYSYDYDTDNYGYFYDINVNSFVDYFILNEFTTNYDAGRLSTYIYKDIGGKYNMAVWDFNSACDNYEHSTISPPHFKLQDTVWFDMLLKDEYFTYKVIDRYRELRKSYLSDEYLNQYMDETIDYLGDAVQRNFSVWDYTFDQDLIQPTERNPRSYEEAVAQMRDFITLRGTWMDEYIETLLQHSHESKVKKFNH